nr:glucose n-acetyltransferase 1 [Quercus suber]POF00915.1 glucose n-acetyltransferase 1 [Quercus suber]
MPGFFGRWTESLPLQDRSSWRYASVTETGGDEDGATKPQPTWRTFLTSKAVWRTVIAIVVVALLADFFHPTRTVLEKQGWVDPHHDTVEVKVHEDCPIDSSTPPPPPVETHADTVDWSQYAYCQYVTNEDYLCNSLMIFESLTRLGVKADKLMLFPNTWRLERNAGTQELLQKAVQEYNVKLQPIEVQRHEYNGDRTWAESFTKLLAFNQTQYKRVMSLDSDATVLKSMDELFLLPSAPVAMPRAYWLEDEPTLSSQLVLVEPSTFEFDRILHAMDNLSSGDFDMEIVNHLYAKDCFIIPHRKYDLLTGEFRAEKHRNYLGSEEEVWDPEKALDEAKFLHFSDWPVPKPWITAPDSLWQEHMPKCTLENGTKDCRNRDKWLWIYEDFKTRRKIKRECLDGKVDRRAVKMGAHILRIPSELLASRPIFNQCCFICSRCDVYISCVTCYVETCINLFPTIVICRDRPNNTCQTSSRDFDQPFLSRLYQNPVSPMSSQQQQEEMAPIHFGKFNVTSQVFHTTPLSFAVVNLKPLLPGHILVSPLRVRPRLSDLTREEISDLFLTVTRVQRTLRRVYKAEAFNVAVQDGEAAGQSVPHVHCHVIPRVKGDPGEGDKVHEWLEGEEGNVGRHQQDAAAAPAGDGKKQKEWAKDEERKPRGMEEMVKEAQWLRDEMAQDASEDGESGKL